MPIKHMSSQEAISFLSAQQVGHLATASPAGHPYVIPLNYLYYQGKLFFHSAQTGLKLDYITANPQVCFEVSQMDKLIFNSNPCTCSARYQSVVVFGMATVVTNSLLKVEVLNALTRKYADGRSFAPVDEQLVAGCAVVEIHVESIHGKRNVDSDGK